MKEIQQGNLLGEMGTRRGFDFTMTMAGKAVFMANDHGYDHDHDDEDEDGDDNVGW